VDKTAKSLFDAVVIPSVALMRCSKCQRDAAALLSFDYGSAKAWLDDNLMGAGHHLCHTHAERFTPPVGWVLVDRRNGVAQVLTLEIA